VRVTQKKGRPNRHEYQESEKGKQALSEASHSTVRRFDMAAEQKPTKAELLNVFSEIFRAVTRPAVTIIFAAVIAQAVTERIELPQWFLGLASACILWWFGDRTVQHIKQNK
jgi:hypothetical protein